MVVQNGTREDSVHNNQREELTCDRPKTITTLMETRHSTRSFLPSPVPHHLLTSALNIAQRAPSNSNIQPWRLKILTGASLQRLTSALLSAVSSGTKPTTAPIPETYRHYRSALGKELYGPHGYSIAREDKEGMEAARQRNYTFFGAPVGMIVYMDSQLDKVDVMCVGMYVQALTLLLAERGLASCVEVSVAGYPDVVRRVCGIEEGMDVLSGVAVGYEDENVPLNKLDMERDDWCESAEFVE